MPAPAVRQGDAKGSLPPHLILLIGLAACQAEPRQRRPRARHRQGLGPRKKTSIPPSCAAGGAAVQVQRALCVAPANGTEGQDGRRCQPACDLGETTKLRGHCAVPRSQRRSHITWPSPCALEVPTVPFSHPVSGLRHSHQSTTSRPSSSQGTVAALHPIPPPTPGLLPLHVPATWLCLAFPPPPLRDRACGPAPGPDLRLRTEM